MNCVYDGVNKTILNLHLIKKMNLCNIIINEQHLSLVLNINLGSICLLYQEKLACQLDKLVETFLNAQIYGKIIESGFSLFLFWAGMYDRIQI